MYTPNKLPMEFENAPHFGTSGIDTPSLSCGLSEVLSWAPTLVIIGGWVEKDPEASSGLNKEEHRTDEQCLPCLRGMGGCVRDKYLPTLL